MNSSSIIPTSFPVGLALSPREDKRKQCQCRDGKQDKKNSTGGHIALQISNRSSGFLLEAEGMCVDPDQCGRNAQLRTPL